MKATITFQQKMDTTLLFVAHPDYLRVPLFTTMSVSSVRRTEHRNPSHPLNDAIEARKINKLRCPYEEDSVFGIVASNLSTSSPHFFAPSQK